MNKKDFSEILNNMKNLPLGQILRSKKTWPFILLEKNVIVEK